MRALFRTPAGAFGASTVALAIAAALLSLLWTPHDPLQVDPSNGWAPVSLAHPLGTDALGRDLASSLLVGARVTLFAAAVATLIAGVLGTLLAGLIELAPRPAGALLQRGVDLMIAFPTLVLAIILVTGFGASTLTAAIAIGLGASAVVARTIAPELRRAAASDFVLLAYAAGVGPIRVLWRHILPAASATLIVRLTQVLAGATLAEAGLSYLGFGTPAPTPSWGRTLADLQAQLLLRPEVLIAPSLCIVLLVLGFNLLGDGLRDSLDPRRPRASRRGTPSRARKARTS